jgi:hypothetical protein
MGKGTDTCRCLYLRYSTTDDLGSGYRKRSPSGQLLELEIEIETVQDITVRILQYSLNTYNQRIA